MGNKGYVNYILASDNSIGITLSNEIQSKNYFVAKIKGKNPTPELLEKLIGKVITFVIHRQNETLVTDSIEILE